MLKGVYLWEVCVVVRGYHCKGVNLWGCGHCRKCIIVGCDHCGRYLVVEVWVVVIVGGV